MPLLNICAEKNLSKIQKCKQITTGVAQLASGENKLKRTYQRYKNVSKSQLRDWLPKLKLTYQRYKNVSKSQPSIITSIFLFC